jgi:outer membrane protein OmpA-like peptidoglycan-associated protein
MKFVHTLAPGLIALLVAACGGSTRQAAAAHAAHEAEEEKEEAQSEAQEARARALREQHEAQEARRAASEAERDAQMAGQRATLAEAQLREAQWQRAPRIGTTERQADGTVRLGAPSATVLFAPNSTELSEDAEARLDLLAKTLRSQTPPRNVIVEGYTDDAGTEATNVRVSQERAREVARYLERKGVAAERIATRGMGAVQAATERGRANGRRVDVTILVR